MDSNNIYIIRQCAHIILSLLCYKCNECASIVSRSIYIPFAAGLELRLLYVYCISRSLLAPLELLLAIQFSLYLHVHGNINILMILCTFLIIK